MGSSMSKQHIRIVPNEHGSPLPNEEHWWGYIEDGLGWTARPKSEYMRTPAYNKELRRLVKAGKLSYPEK